jgi:hypothetical protein
MLIAIGEIFCDAFREGVERAAEEDVVGGVWHDLYLEIYVNIVEGETDVVEVAVHFSDGGVGGLDLQRAFYLSIVTEFLPYHAIHCHYLAARVQDAFYRKFSLDERED